MAPVVKAVSKAVETVVEEVGSAVEQVGETIEQTVQAVAENPEILVIAVAAPYAVSALGTAAGLSTATISAITQPITAAAITASQGGDLEDIGKAALTAYVAPQVGKAVGGTVATAIADSGMSNTMQQTVVNTITSGAAGATSAAIQGGDIGQTALMGAAGGAGGTLAGQTAAEFLPEGVSDSTAKTVIDYAQRAGQVAATGGDVGTALVSKGLEDLAKYGTSKEQAKKEEVAAETPMTKEEIADATFEMLKTEFERAKGLEGGTQVAAAEGETMTDAGIPMLAPVEVVADAENVGELTDAQIIDLVRAGQRRNQEEAGAAPETEPREEGEKPAEGEKPEGDVTQLPPVVVEAPPIEDDISDEEILDLVKLGQERDQKGAETPAEEGGEEIPEGEMELGGGEGEGATPVTPKVFGTPVVAREITRGTAGLPARQVGQGYSAIVGDKEPTFGGDEGPQSEVWNRRSLRLRKALGL